MPAAQALLRVGLGIMQERGKGVGAEVHVQSTPGQGTTVRIALPAGAALHGVAPLAQPPAMAHPAPAASSVACTDA